jgi:hypothetical protein
VAAEQVQDEETGRDRQRHPMIGYSAFEVGLNNQKMALLGLFHQAREQGAAVTLPSMVSFNPALGIHRRIALDRIFPVEVLHRFARAYGITLLDAAPVDSVGAFDCFMLGSGLVAATGAKGMAALDDFTGHFFRGLLPRLAQLPLLQQLKGEIFQARRVGVVVQLRIEKDWAAYARSSLDASLGADEDYKPGFMEIFDKIAQTMPEYRGSVYIVCDETDLPTSKDEIRAAVLARYGLSLVWKSDILGADVGSALSLLEQSVLDFEMALSAPVFVGMSRSTFANMACFEAFCRRGRPPEGHFIYNLPGARLGRRYDRGASVVPTIVCDLLQGRIPLAAPHHADRSLPMTLTAHLSNLGDVTTESCTPGGAYAGPLCCGHRGDGLRLIEGLSLASHVPGLGLEYRVRLSDGQWSAWHAQGNFAGTRGLGQQLSGLNLRLTGPLSMSYVCHLVASFAGQPELVQVEGGQDCVAEVPRPLEAVQLIVRRR